MDFIKETAKNLEVKGEYDVIVVGGGVAGVASALSAARQGAKVLLLEKQYMLGGLATAGLIAIYLAICDGEGRQVSFSIAEELLRLSMKYGHEGRYPKAWFEGGTVEEKKENRFEIQYNPNMCAILFEQILKENGVDILYGTSVCNVSVRCGKIKALIVENKSGRSAYACKSVVDCTGDADICHLAGEDTALFSQGNILASWYYFVKDSKFNLCQLGFSDIPDKYKKKEDIDKKAKRYTGITGEELSEMTIEAHEKILEHYLMHHKEITKENTLGLIATIPQIRMTRRIDGNYVMDDTEMHKEFSDSVGLFSDWRKPGPVYETPFSMLHGSKIKNLITAGRCISVTDAMWDITRVIPVCAVTGEAAGAAAAMTDNFTTFSVEKLQKVLTQRGVVLHEKDL